MFYSIALLAYIIDFFFSEFERFKWFKHPIVFMGEYIVWFEKRFYKDSIRRGAVLVLSLLLIVFCIATVVSWIDSLIIQALVASFTLSSKMLFKSVKDVIESLSLVQKKERIAMLVSRDTQDLSESDVNKACIETYAENLSDGVIAPLFYLVCFGLVGAYLYKAVNTLDSMVGYRTKHYERFGKVAARLDDLLNFIPARITAVLIAVLMGSKKAFNEFYMYGKEHASINAGLPIASMALALDVKLGGETSYFGVLKEKPYFGDGKEQISDEDVQKALSLKPRLDMAVVLLLGVLYVI